MLQLASKQAFKATTHQVVNPSDNLSADRLSLPLFLHFNSNTILTSSGLTAQEYLEQRLKAIYKGGYK
jgi:isopenicillin N synthase-like dioxygenase